MCGLRRVGSVATRVNVSAAQVFAMQSRWKSKSNSMQMLRWTTGYHPSPSFRSGISDDLLLGNTQQWHDDLCGCDRVCAQQLSNRIDPLGIGDFPPHTILTMPSLSPTMSRGKIAGWNVKEGYVEHIVKSDRTNSEVVDRSSERTNKTTALDLRQDCLTS